MSRRRGSVDRRGKRGAQGDSHTMSKRPLPPYFLASLALMAALAFALSVAPLFFAWP